MIFFFCVIENEMVAVNILALARSRIAETGK